MAEFWLHFGPSDHARPEMSENGPARQIRSSAQHPPCWCVLARTARRVLLGVPRRVCARGVRMWTGVNGEWARRLCSQCRTSDTLAVSRLVGRWARMRPENELGTHETFTQLHPRFHNERAASTALAVLCKAHQLAPKPCSKCRYNAAGTRKNAKKVDFS